MAAVTLDRHSHPDRFRRESRRSDHLVSRLGLAQEVMLGATPFVVLATARSGSWHLVELLNEHPNIISNGEILNRDDTSWPAEARPLGSTAHQMVDWALWDAPGRGSKGAIVARGVKVLD